MDAIALSTSLLDELKAEPDLKRLARSYVQKARELLCQRHRAGAGGLEIVAAYSMAMDDLIRHLFAIVSEEFIRRFPGHSQRFVVVAQGGYGRAELNPQSDIDLLFLHPWKISPYVESVTEKLLYTLWDAGLQVGHAARSTSECMRLA